MKTATTLDSLRRQFKLPYKLNVILSLSYSYKEETVELRVIHINDNAPRYFIHNTVRWWEVSANDIHCHLLAISQVFHDTFK